MKKWFIQVHSWLKPFSFCVICLILLIIGVRVKRYFVPKGL